MFGYLAAVEIINMSKKLLVLAVAVPVLAAGAYFGGEYLLSKSADAAIAQIKANLPTGATLSHGKLTTNLLRREVVLEGLEVTAPDAAGPRTLNATRVRLAGLPWVSKGQFELGELVVEGLRVERNGVMTAERWSIERPGVQVINRLTTGENSSIGMGGEFSFAGAEATNLTLSRVNPSVNVTIASIKSGPLVASRLKHVEMLDVKAASQDVTGPLVRLSVNQISGEDVDVTRILAPDGNIDLTTPFLTNGLSGLSITSLTLGPDGGDPISLGALTVKGEGLPDGTRTALSIKADQLIMPTAAMTTPARSYYEEMGYKRMVMDLDMAGRYEPAAQTLALQKFNLVALDAGTVDMKVTLGGMSNLTELSRDAGNAQMLMASMTLNNFDIKVTDSSFVKRHVQHGARKLMVSPEVYVEQMINAIRPVAGGGGQGEQKLARLYRAVSSFLLNPGELTVTAQPEKPVAFLQLLFSLANPSAAAESLNVSANNRQLDQSTQP